MDLLEDERVAQSARFLHMDALVAIIEDCAKDLTADEVEARLTATGVPVSRYHGVLAPNDRTGDAAART